MSKIDTSSWKKFQLSELFDIETTIGTDKNKVKFIADGECDFIGRTSVDYGKQGTLNELDYPPNPGNTYSLVQVGETVALWRERKWYASQNIFILKPRHAEIKNIPLFFQASINKEMEKYGKQYNSYPTLKSLQTETILLPATEYDAPDWEYMHDYIAELKQERIAELEQERIAELDAYFKVTGLNDYVLTVDEEMILRGFYADSIHWEKKTMQELGFDIFHGKRLKKQERIPGNVPLITAGQQKQGVADYVDNDWPVYRDAITVDMFGNTFLHDGICTGDDNIYFFVSESWDESGKEFIVTAIQKALRGKYSYSKQFRQVDADNLSVDMPCNPDGSVNRSYIYIYIRALEKKTIENFAQNWNKTMRCYKLVV